MPGHADHYGNEIADKLANIRQVAYNPELESNKPKLSAANFENKIKNYITSKHKLTWNNSNISKNTKLFINAIANHNLQGQHLFHMGSETLRPLTRLITGHNNLNHYQNLLNPTISPFCRYCESEIHETALHLICDCQHFAAKRMYTFGDNPIDIDQLMKFIRLSKGLDLSSLLDLTGDIEL